jgi:hypothetical protein
MNIKFNFFKCNLHFMYNFLNDFIDGFDQEILEINHKLINQLLNLQIHEVL